MTSLSSGSNTLTYVIYETPGIFPDLSFTLSSTSKLFPGKGSCGVILNEPSCISSVFLPPSEMIVDDLLFPGFGNLFYAAIPERSFSSSIFTLSLIIFGVPSML